MSVIGSNPSVDTALVGEIDKNIKYKNIEPFTGERNKLTGFILQLRLYTTFNGDRFRSETEKVLWAVTLLDGKAMNWIEGFLDDYLTNTNREGKLDIGTMEETTMKIFGTWNGFIGELKANFGVMDERKEAERAIESLRQKGSATAYTREFQRYSTRTEWGDEALCYQYRKGLKDLVKDELLRTGHSTTTLEELVKAACEIDNAWYERSMERKGKYDPDYKRMGEGGYRKGPRNNNYGDPMMIDATVRKEMPPQVRQKHMQDRTCFNCGKTGHMARNCRSGGQQKGHGKHQINATMTSGRGGYNGRMQVNATTRGPTIQINDETHDSMAAWGDDEPFEEINQSLAAVTFVETEGNDVNSESSDETDESDITEEMSQDERMTLEVMSGEKSAEDYQKRITERYESQLKTADTTFWRSKTSSQWLVAKESAKYETIQEYRFSLFHLVQAVKQQIRETQYAEERGIQRRKFYQDRLAANLDYLPKLEKMYRDAKDKGDKKKEEVVQCRKEEDVARIDHPRHAAMGWSFCYTDSCSIHRSSKEDAGYYPNTKRAVYWEVFPRNMTTETGESSQPSKN